MTVPQGYLFINLVFVACLLWSLAQPNLTEPLTVGLLVNTLCLVVEIVAICVFWPGVSSTNLIMFSTVMAVINLLARVITALVLVHDMRKIAGQKETPHQIEE